MPRLKYKCGQYLLKEITDLWPKYLSIVEHISYVFAYLNLVITETTSQPNLKDAALMCFYSLVSGILMTNLSPILLMALTSLSNSRIILDLSQVGLYLMSNSVLLTFRCIKRFIVVSKMLFLLWCVCVFKF